MIIPYALCKPLIKEADVLLFQKGKFPKLGWWIGAFSQSPYSHVGLAHWDHDVNDLYCVEFREFKGSRVYPVDKYAEERPDRIDVFRICSTISIPHVEFDHYGYRIVYDELIFTDKIAHQITNKAISLIGERYAWNLMWNFAKSYIPGLRLQNGHKTKDDKVTKAYVCSTLITAAYREFFIDPVDFLADEYTKPGDLARSVVLHKLFTIGK